MQKSEYLSQAETCRSRALKATSEWRRKQLLELAQQWEKLGAQLAALPMSNERDELRAKSDDICALLADLGYRRLVS